MKGPGFLGSFQLTCIPLGGPTSSAIVRDRCSMPSGAASRCGGQALVATLTLVCACRPSPAVHAPPTAFVEPLATLPLISAGGMFFVAVGSDSAPARLWLLDSGFETSVVNRRYADSLRLPSY